MQKPLDPKSICTLLKNTARKHEDAELKRSSILPFDEGVRKFNLIPTDSYLIETMPAGYKDIGIMS